MSQVLDAAQDQRQQWLQERRSGIGGSDAAAILGLSTWGSPMSLYCDKIGLSEESDEVPEYIEWGNILEPVIADKYASVTGRTLEDPGRYTIQRHPEKPFLRCTVDRFITETVKRVGVLSVKTAGAFKREDWLEEPPVPYQVQAQHELLVTGLQMASFAVLIGGQQFLWADQPRNESFCQLLQEKEEEFWEMVLSGTPPPADDHKATEEAIRRLYPRDTGKTIALPREFIAIDQRFHAVKESIKRLKAKEALFHNQLAAAIGDATFAKLPSGVSYSYKTSPRKGYTVAPTETRTLRRIEK